jgi:hypothetical protein
MSINWISGTLFIIGMASLPIHSQAQNSANNIKIASCNVVNPKSGNITAVTVFRNNDANKLIEVILTLPSGSKDYPADAYEFSRDGSSLQIQAAQFFIINIVKGQGTKGTIGVALGAPPSDMSCDANW